MLWIKRNMFLAVGGLVALILLGLGVFLLLGARSRNEELETQIEETKTKLQTFDRAAVSATAANVDVAKKEAEKLKGASQQLQRFFTPVPAEKVVGLEFRRYRDNTLAELHRAAEQARTTLPSKNYSFSFETQKSKVEFREGTFPAIPQQMAEVKALCRILFDAHVDPLVNIRRARVSEDDVQGNTATDYLAGKVETNAQTMTVTSPYEFTFHCLSAELAAVMQGLLQSPHGFVVKAIHVEPAVEVAAAAQPGQAPVQQPPPNQPPRRYQPPPPPPGPGATGAPPPRTLPPPPATAAKPGTDKAVVLLKERRLRVTLLVHVIKALK
jgi:hypothetical protein